MIDFYRKAISPYRPSCCRFIPSCSLYAREAVLEYGALRGSYLAVRRLLRCHPFHSWGYDPVKSRTKAYRGLSRSNPEMPRYCLLIRKPARKRRPDSFAAL